jgi:glycosyltransferase involved in cell wall biosynthesis
MTISLIIAVYKDVLALELIIESLKKQTYRDFEVVIAEDGKNQEMKHYIQSIENLKIKHTSQKDDGVQKAKSQNNGILASTGEYLIFIDGDCILYSTFIEAHYKLAKKACALSGRRLNLNKTLTRKIKDGIINSSDIEKNILTKYLPLSLDRTARFEQGIYFKPNGLMHFFLKKRKRNVAILGCNFSCWKEDMVALNGFDESYTQTGLADDVDWDWRFKAYGIKVNSCKNIANMMHLSHPIYDRDEPTEQLKNLEDNKRKNLYICKHGLNTH